MEISLNRTKTKSQHSLSSLAPPEPSLAIFLQPRMSQMHSQASLQSKGQIEKHLIFTKYRELLDNKLIHVIINSVNSDEEQVEKEECDYHAQIQKFDEIQQKELQKELSPLDTDPSPVGCELLSYKLLVELSNLKPLTIAVPDTFICGHGFDTPTLIYNDGKELKIIQKINPKAFDLILKLFSKFRIFQPRITPPIAMFRAFNSICNRVVMRSSDFKSELKKVHKKEVFLQRYIIPKGNLSSKFRVIYKNDQIKLFRITNKTRFDRIAYEEKKTSDLNSEHRKKGKIYKKSSFESNSEGKFDSFEEFMNAIEQSVVEEDVQSLYSRIVKFNEKNCTQEVESGIEDNVSPKINFMLQKMFCTYSKELKGSRIAEMKSLANFKSMVEAFVLLRNVINSGVLLKQNKKISVFMCDFFEDSQKNVYFSQIKYCKCVESVYIPLKVQQKQKCWKSNWKCPGKYCNNTTSSTNVEVFAESILMPSKTVYPKKCKILVGTIFDEKFDACDNMQKLNPKLFERTKVCKNCFQAYTKLLLENKPKPKPPKKEQKTQQILDINSYFKTEVKAKLRQNSSYMAKRESKTFTYTDQKLLNQTLLPKLPTLKPITFFDQQKPLITENMKFDSFV